MKKPLSDIVSSQNEMRKAGEKRKKFYSRIPFVLDPGQKITKKITKKLKKLKKPLSEFIFSLNGMRQAEKERKKFYSRMPFILHPAMKIPKKVVKKLKKFKNQFLTLFVAETG